MVVVPELWRTDSVVVAQRLSCSKACGIFSDQESNQSLLHWEVDSLPLSLQGSPQADSLETEPQTSGGDSGGESNS